MLARIRQFLTPLEFEDEEKTRVARLLNVVLLVLLATAALVAVVAGGMYALSPDPSGLFTALSGAFTALLIVGLFVLARRDRFGLASGLLLGFTWLVITAWILAISGVTSDSTFLMYSLIIVLAGLLLGGRAAMVMTVASILAVIGAFWAEASGLLVVEEQPASFLDPFFIVLPMLLLGIMLRYAVNSMAEALRRAQENERAQAEANRELEALRTSLEQRVAERTFELERRSAQLQAATEVSRAATSILDPNDLIWQVAELIQERFNLYHIGLFLLDESGEWAAYRAGGGAGAYELWEERFRLPVGGDSMVGWCTANARARVAQDVKMEGVHTEHDLVPETRSEAALPLIARGQVIGALSVQSDRPSAFDQATVAALQTMADQVAVAVENARLFAESQEALEATRRAYGDVSRQAWTQLLQARTDWGYRFEDEALVPAGGDWQPELVEALRTGRAVVNSDLPLDGLPAGEGAAAGQEGAALALPLRVRDDVIGVLGFYRDPIDGLPAGEVWTSEEQDLLQRLVDQLGTALESAQLFQETQRRVAREQTIRQVTERMRSAVEIEDILQNTVAELARAMGAQRAYVRLGTESELLGDRAGLGTGKSEED